MRFKERNTYKLYMCFAVKLSPKSQQETLIINFSTLSWWKVDRLTLTPKDLLWILSMSFRLGIFHKIQNFCSPPSLGKFVTKTYFFKFWPPKDRISKCQKEKGWCLMFFRKFLICDAIIPKLINNYLFHCNKVTFSNWES